jgi:predicted Zn-dependent protease with MMP-like domain
MSWERLLELAHAEVTRTVAELPDDLRVRAASLPVTYERMPSRALEEEGIEPDTLGLFVGGDFLQEANVPVPAQIILFLQNIDDMVEGDEEEFREEVRVTLIHELGHYLGLDEDELERRGLL